MLVLQRRLWQKHRSPILDKLEGQAVADNPRDTCVITSLQEQRRFCFVARSYSRPIYQNLSEYHTTQKCIYFKIAAKFTAA